MAFGQTIPVPFAARRGRHEFSGDFTRADFGELGGFLGLADVLARGCVLVHRVSQVKVFQNTCR